MGAAREDHTDTAPDAYVHGIGALAIGIAADLSGAMETGFWLTAVAMGLSGLWVLLAAEETHPRLNPARNCSQ